MAVIMDGEKGGKHNSDSTETSISIPSFRVSIFFECIDGKTPLEAAKKIAEMLKEESYTLIYDVINEDTKDKFTVDLSEEDEDAVLPNDED